MDKSKKIMIGAIGTVVVAGGVIIGLILGRTPPKADLSTIHTEASTEAPAENKPQETKAPETEPSTLSVSCEIISADPKRLTAVYTGELSIEGGAHPSRIFYTNTLNLNQMKDMGLNDFTDAYTMAGYVLSEDVRFPKLNAEETSAALEYRSTQSMEALTAVFENADFPLSGKETWPESFSYEKQGRIYFSLPVPHALGDYVIVEFDPATK